MGETIGKTPFQEKFTAIIRGVDSFANLVLDEIYEGVDNVLREAHDTSLLQVGNQVRDVGTQVVNETLDAANSISWVGRQKKRSQKAMTLDRQVERANFARDKQTGLSQNRADRQAFLNSQNQGGEK